MRIKNNGDFNINKTVKVDVPIVGDIEAIVSQIINSWEKIAHIEVFKTNGGGGRQFFSFLEKTKYVRF